MRFAMVLGYCRHMSRRFRFDLPTIDRLLAFESVFRHGRFSRAAEEMGTAQPVVSRHIARLETLLHTRLFVRSRAGTRPTPAGEKLYEGISAGLETIRRGILEARTVTDEKRVIVACPPEVWQLLLLPLLDSLQDALGASVRIEVRVRRDDPEADVAFGWYGETDAADMLRFVESGGPVCAPRYATVHSEILNGPVAGWGGLEFLDCPPPGPGWTTWNDWFAVAGRPSPRPRPRRLASYLAVLEAAAAGRGLALGRERFVARHLEAGVLVALGDGFAEFGDGLYATLTGKGRAKPLARNAMAFIGQGPGGRASCSRHHALAG